VAYGVSYAQPPVTVPRLPKGDRGRFFYNYKLYLLKYLQRRGLCKLSTGMKELLKILDKVNINELGMRQKLESEIARFNIFQRSVLGATEKIQNNKDTDIRNYSKYILK
jgi:hypothetical protein